MNPTKQHVHDLADVSPPHEYVADHGTVVDGELKRISLAGNQITVSADVTEDDLALIKKAIQLTHLREKECFANALKLWQYNDRFEYAEGYAALSIDPDYVGEHAWAMLDGAKLVDPIPEYKHHYGVVISSQEVLEQNIGVNINSEGIICGRRNYDFLRKQGYQQ